MWWKLLLLGLAAILAYAWVQNRERALTKKIKAKLSAPTESQNENDDQEVAIGAEVSSESMVDLTDEDFVDRIKEGTWIVLFYAPLCGHCQDMEPVYEKCGEAAKEAQLNGKAAAQVARMDVTDNRKIATREQISGTPALIKYRNGKRTETYRGDRSFGDLLKFAMQ